MRAVRRSSKAAMLSSDMPRSAESYHPDCHAPQGTMLPQTPSESHAPSMLIRPVASNAIWRRFATMKSVKPLITLASPSSVRKIEGTLSTHAADKHNMAVIDIHEDQGLPQVISVDRIIAIQYGVDMIDKPHDIDFLRVLRAIPIAAGSSALVLR